MSNLSILPWPFWVLQTRACRASREPCARPQRCVSRAGRGIPMPRPALGRAFSARGHTEREDPGVKGRQTLDRGRGEDTRRAGGETLRRTECARRTMIPKIAFPSVNAANRVCCGGRTPSTLPDRKNPRRPVIRVPDQNRAMPASETTVCRSAVRACSIRSSSAHDEGRDPLIPPFGVRVTRCRRPCRRCRGSRRSCRQRRGRSSSRSRRPRRGPCR